MLVLRWIDKSLKKPYTHLLHIFKITRLQIKQDLIRQDYHCLHLGVPFLLKEIASLALTTHTCGWTVHLSLIRLKTLMGIYAYVVSLRL